MEKEWNGINNGKTLKTCTHSVVWAYDADLNSDLTFKHKCQGMCHHFKSIQGQSIISVYLVHNQTPIIEDAKPRIQILVSLFIWMLNLSEYLKTGCIISGQLEELSQRERRKWIHQKQNMIAPSKPPICPLSQCQR